MLVTLANGGSTRWMAGNRDLRQLYGGRANLVKMLAKPNTPGPDHILYATDDLLPPQVNFLDAPPHILCGRTASGKIVTNNHWFPSTTRMHQRGRELEFYDYRTHRGRLELHNTPNDPRARAMLRTLLTDWLPNEMRKPLPPSLRPAQRRAKAGYITFNNVLAAADKLTTMKELAHTAEFPYSRLEFGM
jgi:uncharacterized sulfatase